jgi:hypothetical protein
MTKIDLQNESTNPGDGGEGSVFISGREEPPERWLAKRAER